MKDKKETGKSQHRFTKIKLSWANLIAFYDEVASSVNRGEQWISMYLDFCKMFDMISHILVEADKIWPGQISLRMDGKLSKVLNSKGD